MRWLHTLLVVACAAGLVLLVARSGPGTLWHDATALGWTIAAIVALFGLEHAVRAAAWWCCYRPELRPPLRRLFWARLASYAVNTTTPSATLGGEVVRSTLLARTVPTIETVTAISVDRLGDTLADCTFGFCGLVVVLLHAPFPIAARLGLLAAAVLLATGVGAFTLLQRRGRLAAFVTERAWLAPLWNAAASARLLQGGRALDQRLQAFHAERPHAVLLAFALHLVGTSVAAVQIACFLIGVGVPADASVVLRIFLVSVALDLFSFFVPARLGAQEGARMVAVALVGLPARLGLLYSLVLRVEQLAWAAVGLLAYLALAPGAVRARTVAPAADERVPELTAGAAFTKRDAMRGMLD